MRRYATIVVATLGTSPAFAGPYLFELLEIGSYRASWDDLFQGEKDVPDWLIIFSETSDGVATPSEDVRIGGMDYIYTSVCKPRDCGDNMLHVVFAQTGEGAWALLEENPGAADMNLRFFGNPTELMATALLREANARR